MGIKGNKYWQKRTKHGRDRIIQEPQTLLDASEEYFQWCLDNPVIEIDYKTAGRDLHEVRIPHPRVFQKGELARFCHVAKWETINDLKKVSDDFMEIITHIEGIIRDQKFRYATVGMFNANIVAKDLGLANKVEHTGGSDDDNPVQIMYIGGKPVEFK